MGCKKLTYYETLSPLKVVCSDLDISEISCVGSYRYGFNGMEKDDEVKGEGNSYTTEFRQYDPRVGRWLSIDPLFKNFPWQSPYVAFDNNPIYYKDPKGLAAEGGGDEPGFWSKFGTEVLDWIPGVGTVKGAWEGITGGRWFTGDELEPWERWIGWVPYVKKVKYLKKPIKWIGGLFKKGKNAPKLKNATKSDIKIGELEHVPDQSKGVVKKNTRDRTANDPLRTDEHGRKIPDPEAKGSSHTQLGTKKGRKGKYKQGREFNKENQEQRDIDFTNHGRPKEHTNPHQHTYSGKGKGNRERGKAEELK